MPYCSAEWLVTDKSQKLRCILCWCLNAVDNFPKRLKTLRLVVDMVWPLHLETAALRQAVVFFIVYDWMVCEYWIESYKEHMAWDYTSITWKMIIIEVKYSNVSAPASIFQEACERMYVSTCSYTRMVRNKMETLYNEKGSASGIWEYLNFYFS